MTTHITAETGEPALGLPHRLVDAALDSPSAVSFDRGFEAVDRLVAWAEAQRLRLASALRADGRTVVDVLDPSSIHCSMASFARIERRADVVQLFPGFHDALTHGEVSLDHLDRLGKALRRLLANERDLLAADHARLLAVAGSEPAARFGRFLSREVTRFELRRPVPDPSSVDGPGDDGAGDDGAGDDPADARFAAQRAGIRLTSHTDRDTGMVIHRLALDPLRSLAFERRIATMVESLHHGPPIEGCPSDPLERQGFLRAHALLLLLEGEGGARPSGAEIIVVVDHTAPDDTPDIDWGRPVDIPSRVVDELLREGTTRVHEVGVRNGVVITAPGTLDLGRGSRLANTAQRRALRALYRGCGIPGCEVGFEHCTIHHITWWRHGGTTDLHNLLPVCSRHHHLVHDRGWQLELGPNRELRVTTPSGRVMSTGPPRRWAD